MNAVAMPEVASRAGTPRPLLSAVSPAAKYTRRRRVLAAALKLGAAGLSMRTRLKAAELLRPTVLPAVKKSRWFIQRAGFQS